VGGPEMAPHTPQRAARPGKPVARLDVVDYVEARPCPADEHRHKARAGRPSSANAAANARTTPIMSRGVSVPMLATRKA